MQEIVFIPKGALQRQGHFTTYALFRVGVSSSSSPELYCIHAKPILTDALYQVQCTLTLIQDGSDLKDQESKQLIKSNDKKGVTGLKDLYVTLNSSPSIQIRMIPWRIDQEHETSSTASSSTNQNHWMNETVRVSPSCIGSSSIHTPMSLSFQCYTHRFHGLLESTGWALSFMLNNFENHQISKIMIDNDWTVEPRQVHLTSVRLTPFDQLEMQMSKRRNGRVAFLYNEDYPAILWYWHRYFSELDICPLEASASVQNLTMDYLTGMNNPNDLKLNDVKNDNTHMRIAPRRSSIGSSFNPVIPLPLPSSQSLVQVNNWLSQLIRFSKTLEEAILQQRPFLVIPLIQHPGHWTSMSPATVSSFLKSVFNTREFEDTLYVLKDCMLILPLRSYALIQSLFPVDNNYANCAESKPVVTLDKMSTKIQRLCKRGNLKVVVREMNGGSMMTTPISSKVEKFREHVPKLHVLCLIQSTLESDLKHIAEWLDGWMSSAKQCLDNGSSNHEFLLSIHCHLINTVPHQPLVLKQVLQASTFLKQRVNSHSCTTTLLSCWNYAEASSWDVDIWSEQVLSYRDMVCVADVYSPVYASWTYLQSALNIQATYLDTSQQGRTPISSALIFSSKLDPNPLWIFSSATFQNRFDLDSYIQQIPSILKLLDNVNLTQKNQVYPQCFLYSRCSLIVLMQV